jgi:hypothetical protein
VRVLGCLGRLAGVREPGKDEHEREVSERAGCTSSATRRSAAHGWCWRGKVLDDE